ncbi:MAG: YjbH domain-containing protein [Synergistaceae bacterium]|nr:YjbH domain-containing protein [Synergistaceae bacterium]
MITQRCKLFFYSLIFLLMLAIPSYAVSPSNSGLAGLWEYPSAEMPGDGMGWISFSDFSPYRSGSASLGLFPWLELNIRLTEFANADLISPGYGRYKDKAMDLKFLLAEQKGLRPALAIGALDMMGTEIRKAYFAAGTWKYEDIALTLGYATDTYNGFYGGISWEPLKWLELKAEYSPLDYTQDKIGGKKLHPGQAKEKYNLGIVLKSEWGLNGSLSYQRGEEFCFGLSYAFDLTKPVFGGKNKAKIDEPLLTDWDKTDIEKTASELQAELGKKGFGLRNTVVLAGDKKIHVAFENIGYSSQAEAAARVIILTAHKIPWDTEVCSFSTMVRGNPVSRIEFNTEKMALIRLHELDAYDLNNESAGWAPKTKYGTLPGEEWQVMAGPGESIRNGTADIRIALAYEPRIDRTLDNDYMGRLDVDYIGHLRSSQGWEAYLKVRQPIDNEIDIWWQPEMNDKTRIWKGVLSYIHKLNERTWALGEVGWLDENYFGANFWGRYFLKDSPFWIGGRVSVVKERDFDSFAGLSDYRREYYNGKAYYLSVNG